VQSLLATAVERQAVGKNKGFSGATVERYVLADGRILIVKRISPIVDISMRLSQDRGRAATLWTSGIFDRLPPLVDSAMLAAEPEGDGWILAMEDVSEAAEVYPALTTVRQPMAEMGETALELLVTLLEGRPTLSVRRELPTELIIRDSTGRNPNT
jgi:hypothetical protein